MNKVLRVQQQTVKRFRAALAPEAGRRYMPEPTPVASSLKRFPLRLLLPPLLLVGVYLTVKSVTGPYFLSPNFDPDYVYLFNALNIVLGQRPAHTDHPGTPLQLLGAAWIKLLNLGASDVETATNTIANSEARLDQLNLLVFFLLLCTVTVAGLVIYRKSQKMLPAFLSSAGLLFLGANVYCLGRFNPEPFLWLDSFLLGLSIYWYCCLDQITRPAAESACCINSSPVFALLAAFFVATGLAAKINSAPLALLPLFLVRGWRYKLAYVFLAFAMLALWLIPDYGQLERMAQWVKTLATHTQRYGGGQTALLNAHSYVHNALGLAAKNLPYFLLITGSFILAINGLFRARNTPGEAPAKAPSISVAGVLLAVSGCQLLQFLLTCKYQESRYLIPGMGLAALNLLLLLGSGGFVYVQRWLKPVVVVLGLAGAIFAAGSLARLGQKTTEHLKVFESGQSFLGKPCRIYGYGASSPYYAWYFGNSFCGWSYGALLYRMVPESDRIFFYNNFAGNCLDYRSKSVSNEFFQSRGPVIFQSPPFGGDDRVYNWPEGLKLTEKFGGPLEKIYVVEAVAVPSDLRTTPGIGGTR